MKNTLKYIILLILSIVLVVSITFTYLDLHYSEKGTIKINNGYYDIVFSNVLVENDDAKVKINNDEDSIHIGVNNIIENKEIELSLDLKNIGSKDVFVDNFSYANIDSNVDLSKIEIISSLEKNTIIKGGESKKLFVKIKYNGKEKIEDSYYNFNINYVFQEVKL